MRSLPRYFLGRVRCRASAPSYNFNRRKFDQFHNDSTYRTRFHSECRRHGDAILSLIAGWTTSLFALFMLLYPLWILWYLLENHYDLDVDSRLSLHSLFSSSHF